MDEKPEMSKQDLLRRKLTPKGRAFLKRLDKALAEELAKLRNVAGDAVRAEIERHHMRNLDSVKSINRCAASGQPSRLTAYYLILNYSSMLLQIGRPRVKPGLTPLEEQILQIWRIYANKVIEAGVATQAQIDAAEKELVASRAPKR